MPLHFSHIALSCRDPLATERFYAQHFGFRRARVIPLGGTAQIVFLKREPEGIYLELFASEGESPMPPAEKDGPAFPAIRHLAFQVDDVDEVLATMGDAAQVTLGPLAFDAFIPGWRTVWLRDPDGNIVEVSQGFTDQQDPPALAD